MRRKIEKKLREDEVIRYITIFAYGQSKLRGTLTDVEDTPGVKACYVYTNQRVFIVSDTLKS